MSESDESLSIESVRALVAERSRFDEWLRALESRRDATPSHVFERVHGDYTARRATVIEQLSAHVPALSTLLASLDTRAESLGATMASHEDERAEAMLRHTVGEFDDATWEEVRTRVEATLERLFSEQVALEEQRDDVRRLLTESTPPEGWVPAGAAIAVSEADGMGEEPADASAGEDMTATASAATASAHDELAGAVGAEAESIDTSEWAAATEAAATPSGQGDEGPSWTSDEAARAEAARAEAARAEAESDGAPLPGGHAPVEADATDAVRVSSVTETLASIDADVVDEVAPEPPRPESSGYERASIWGGGVPSAPADAPAAPADAFDELAFLRSVIDPKAAAASGSSASGTTGVGAPQKTLRCTECSTMNLPTEWYCERCGSELASF